MTLKTTVGLVCALALAACGQSPPTRYFSLDAVPPSAPLATAAARMAPVQLGAVRIPPSLDRPEIVVQDAAYRLAVRDNDHWGAPLAPMIRGALAQDLEARLPPGSFVLPDAPAPAGARGIVVTVLDLRANTNGRMTFEGSWTLTAGEPPRAVMTQNVSLTEPMSSADSPAIADALSRVLGRVADRIAASLATQR
ncbi:PqiC family protein [Trinickia acidisoli]|uniref:PqiC family protein n=1 Tax=Trinickia acidisoli TaxID=2767482 RepID=UPI001A900CFE|nr:PqiC family protein [Trinickia acidisoli]